MSVSQRALTTDYKVQADAPVTHFQVAEAVHRIEAAWAELQKEQAA